MSTPPSAQPLHIRFIGSAGIPNRYGGFESFLENCAPVMAALGHHIQVTCDAHLYENKEVDYRGVERVFISTPANGGWSMLHDLLAFSKTFPSASHIVVLGVSGGFWFPLFRLLCDLTGKRLLVNVDGVEWRRTKFGRGKRLLLKALDVLAQKFAHTIIYDNLGLRPYLLDSVQKKAICIAYSGDHVLHLEDVSASPDTALTICRIEPENNLEILIEGALLSRLQKYTIVGNWNHSPYARQLRQRYADESRLALMDPIYDTDRLARLRTTCGVYIHGHSVGGTNPSLVEMLFYDCHILCFDVEFNRHTAAETARYFRDPLALKSLIDETLECAAPLRQAVRKRFTATAIAHQYLGAMLHGAAH